MARQDALQHSELNLIYLLSLVLLQSSLHVGSEKFPVGLSFLIELVIILPTKLPQYLILVLVLIRLIARRGARTDVKHFVLLEVEQELFVFIEQYILDNAYQLLVVNQMTHIKLLLKFLDALVQQEIRSHFCLDTPLASATCATQDVN